MIFFSLLLFLQDPLPPTIVSEMAHGDPAKVVIAFSKPLSAPAMGQRFRLKAAVDISGFPRHAQAIVQALKKHGMLVADNGGDWDLSVPPDGRLKGLEALRKLKGSDFEVIVSTGENEAGR